MSSILLVLEEIAEKYLVVEFQLMKKVAGL